MYFNIFAFSFVFMDFLFVLYIFQHNFMANSDFFLPSICPLAYFHPRNSNLSSMEDLRCLNKNKLKNMDTVHTFSEKKKLVKSKDIMILAGFSFQRIKTALHFVVCVVI